MRTLRRCLLFCFLLAGLAGRTQQAAAVLQYIETYKDLAMSEMIRTGVPAAITLAQGIHESGAGMSNLVLSSNNHFGIKCKSNWTGETVRHDDDAKGECFRKYPRPEDSFRDHSDFLRSGQRYAFLFQLDPADYTGWANGLKQAGYATNPKYPQVLIKLVEDYNLQQYTLLALGRQPAVGGNVVAATDTARQTIPPAIKTEETMPAAKPRPQYPEGAFTINETKVVFIKKGTSYLAVAKQYDVDLSKLFEFNEIPRSEETDDDQLVYLQRKRKTGADEYHTVMPGETLHDIAQQQGIRIESLMEFNWLKEGERPAPGERLNLKKKANSIPRLALRDNFELNPSARLKPSTN